jgi:hypothetical protein
MTQTNPTQAAGLSLDPTLHSVLITGKGQRVLMLAGTHQRGTELLHSQARRILDAHLGYVPRPQVLGLDRHPSATDVIDVLAEFGYTASLTPQRVYL